MGGMPITIDLAQAVLSNVLYNPASAAVTPERIAQAVSEYYGVELDALKGQKRDRAIVMPRQIAMYLMRAETDVSLLRIGAGARWPRPLDRPPRLRQDRPRDAGERGAPPGAGGRPRADLHRVSASGIRRSNGSSIDFEVDFSNGGGIQGQGFRLDVPTSGISDAEVAALLVRELGLLMVGEVRITASADIAEPHRRRTSPRVGMADGTSRLIELSHVIRDGLVTYPGLPAPVITDHLSREASREHYAPGTEFQIGRITMVANTGTYVDTPAHRYADGQDLSELGLERLVDLDGVVVDVRGAIERAIGPEVFLPYDVTGRAVLVLTGWARHFGTPEYLAGHPFLTGAAAAALVAAGAHPCRHRLPQHRRHLRRRATRPYHAPGGRHPRLRAPHGSGAAAHDRLPLQRCAATHPGSGHLPGACVGTGRQTPRRTCSIQRLMDGQMMRTCCMGCPRAMPGCQALRVGGSRPSH